MAVISLKWFGGMIPRAGEQPLPPPYATEAENCNLYSGELRPLNKPALAHVFWSPTETDLLTTSGVACKVYECDAYDTAIRASNPAVYYPMTGGLSETNALINPVPIGTLLYEQMGTNDPSVLAGASNSFNVLGTPLYPNRCSGQQTSFQQDGTACGDPDPMGLCDQGDECVAGTCDPSPILECAEIPTELQLSADTACPGDQENCPAITISGPLTIVGATALIGGSVPSDRVSRASA